MKKNLYTIYRQKMKFETKIYKIENSIDEVRDFLRNTSDDVFYERLDETDYAMEIAYDNLAIKITPKISKNKKISNYQYAIYNFQINKKREKKNILLKFKTLNDLDTNTSEKKHFKALFTIHELDDELNKNRSYRLIDDPLIRVFDNEEKDSAMNLFDVKELDITEEKHFQLDKMKKNVVLKKKSRTNKETYPILDMSYDKSNSEISIMDLVEYCCKNSIGFDSEKKRKKDVFVENWEFFAYASIVLAKKAIHHIERHYENKKYVKKGTDNIICPLLKDAESLFEYAIKLKNYEQKPNKYEPLHLKKLYENRIKSKRKELPSDPLKHLTIKLTEQLVLNNSNLSWKEIEFMVKGAIIALAKKNEIALSEKIETQTFEKWVKLGLDLTIYDLFKYKSLEVFNTN